MTTSDLLMLIINSKTYPSMRNSNTQKKIYSQDSKNLKTIWYRGDPDITPDKYKLLDRDLIVNCSDDSANMGFKTVLAFEWALENIEFNYLIRPTPSSYVNIKYINKLILQERFNEELIYAGTIQKTLDNEGKEFKFISGSTLILNKKCVELIVENKALWDHSYWDDVALAKLLESLNVPMTDIQRTDIKGNPFKQEINVNNYQFRCRADNHYAYPRIIESSVLKIMHTIVTKGKIGKIKTYLYNLYFEILKLFYVYQLSWKTFMLLKKILKYILPSRLHKYLKILLSKQIESFKLKRFKY